MVKYFKRGTFNLEDINKAYIVGCANGEILKFRNNAGQILVRTVLQVPRQSGRIDYIPIAIDNDIFNEHEEVIRTKTLAYCGDFRGYRGKRKYQGKFDSHILVDLIDENVDEYKSNNNIELYGTIESPPKSRLFSDGSESCYVNVCVNNLGFKSHIPCFAKNDYKKDIECLRVDDRIYFLGRIRSREFHIPHTNQVENFNEIEINKVKSIEY